MVRKSKSNCYKTTPQIKAEMLIEHGVNISVPTTQRRLGEGGYLLTYLHTYLLTYLLITYLLTYLLITYLLTYLLITYLLTYLLT